jgi:tetratricopeptide (TPR) repeat protein
MADSLGTSHLIQPFWKRLHKFFIYPLTSLHSLGLLTGLALLSSLLPGDGIILSLVHIALWAVMLKYSFEALKATADGHFSPPPLSSKVLSSNLQMVFKQVALFLALSLIATLLIFPMGPFAWLVYYFVVTLGLPVMIIILAINDDLGQALNPVYFLGIALRIGWSYLLLLFFLNLLISAPSALGYYVIRFMPEALQEFFFRIALNYYTLVSYHLMGYVILQYHDRVGYIIDPEALQAAMYPGLHRTSPKPADLPQNDADHEMLQKIENLIQEGDLDGAIDLIKKETKLKINDVGLSDRYVNLLKLRNRFEELAAYAPRHFELLAAAEDKTKSLELYLVCLEKAPGLKLSPAMLFKMGNWLNETGRAKEALHALTSMAKGFPQDPLVPKAYFRIAQILHEKLSQTDKAKKILSAQLQRFPDHEFAPIARNYLKSLN